jgi:hypothetical protein
MLVLKKELWDKDKILKVECTNKWESTDTSVMVECVLQEIKLLLESVTDTKAILILDCNKGEVPPLFQLGKIFTFLSSIKELIKKSVYFSIIYAKLGDHMTWLDIVLKMYTPARPIHVAKNKDELKNYIQNKESFLK